MNTNVTKQFQIFSKSRDNNLQDSQYYYPTTLDAIQIFKRGSKIRIKKQNRGKFTEYCGGKVTQECINKGKNSPDPKIRKRATFAANARKWSKH